VAAGEAYVDAQTARALAMAINCTGDPRPCGDCRACKRIATGSHPDVRIVVPAGAQIKIDQVRELQHELALSALEARARVAIFEDFDRATTEAMNALLKTLEEPPSNVVLILIAPEADVLLPTIVSRCQLIVLRPLTVAQVRDALIGHRVDKDHAELLAHLSGGRLGWALTASNDEAILETRRTRLDELRQLLNASRVDRFAYAQQLSRDTSATREAIDLWRTWWRDVMLTSAGSKAQLTNIDRYNEIETIARQVDAQQARTAAEACSRALWQLDKNAAARLVIEVMLLDLPSSR